MERARASDPAAPDLDGGRQEDGEQGGARATPQDVPWGHGYGFQTGRGHAPVPEARGGLMQGEQREDASLHVFMNFFEGHADRGWW